MSARILVAGATGQVARALVAQRLEAGESLVSLGRPDLDLANPATLRATIAAHKPDVIINAAADTDVEGAEVDAASAWRINAAGAETLAAEAARVGAALIYISTDFVFDGAGGPYAETAEPRPLNAYGASKLAGERLVAAAHAQAAIVRTSWVISPWSRNFVRTVLRFAETREEITVVADQRGNPTSATDLAPALLSLARRLAADRNAAPGLLHLASPEPAVWADLAEATFAASAKLGGPTAHVRRIPSVEFPQKAQRPADSRLDCTRAKRLYGLSLPDWRVSLPGIVETIVRETQP